MGNRIINFAHRGASGTHPENTMAAFRYALDNGADGIELDVQLTRDGKLVLIHDYTVDRTTSGSGAVRELDYDQLRELDAGSWFAPQFQGEPLPLLEELFELTRGKPVTVNVELKFKGDSAGLEQKVLQCIAAFGMKQQVIISCFNYESLQLCRQIDPEVPVAWLFSNESIEHPAAKAAALGAAAIHPHKKLVTPELMAEAKAHGLRCHPYTSNEPEEWDHLIALGVDGIITDVPEKLSQALQS